MSKKCDADSSTMSTSLSSYHDQSPPYARRVHQHHPPSSFGRAQGRCAPATPANTSECLRYPPFGFSTAATSQSGVGPQRGHRSSPSPLTPAQVRPSSRQGTHEPPSRPSGSPVPSSYLQSPRSVASSLPPHAGSNSGHSQRSHSTTDKREFEIELFEGPLSSDDLQLNQAFVPPIPPSPKTVPRPPAYHYTPSTSASHTAASGNKTRERAPTPQPRSSTSSQPSFNSIGVGGMQPTNKAPTSISGTSSRSNSRSGGYSQSFSTRDSALSCDFSAPSAAASTPNTQLSDSGTGLDADSKWLSGVGYDGARSAQAFSKATGGGRNDDSILMGTARSGHWVNHLVIRTRREHIAGRYYVDPNLDVPDHATPLKTNSLNPTYRRTRSNSFSEGAPALGRTNGGRDLLDPTLSSHKGKQGSQATPWKPGATANETTCHALIGSKSGDIDIKLHIGGLGQEHAKKALIDVRSKTGKLRVKLIELSGGRRVHLDVVTGKGNIEVFLPRSFSGPLHVHSVTGEITILPRLASTMEVIAAREDDALVMVSPAPPTPWTVLSDDDSSSVEVPIEEEMPLGSHYVGQDRGSLTAISETGGPTTTTTHPNPGPRIGSPSPKPWAKYSPEQDDGRFRRKNRPVSLPFDLSELRPYGTNGFGAGAQDWNGDFASVVSAKGNVVVGLVGEDVESGKQGFWKKLTGAFKGRN